jgi:hypothetical protein
MAMPQQETPKAIEKRGIVKEEHARFSSGQFFVGLVLVVGLGAFVPLLAGLLYGENWGTGLSLGVFMLATYALLAMTAKPEAPPATARQLGFPGWSLVSYCVIIGLGFNWACVFLWFSRRYSFFSAPVIAGTGLIMAFCAAIAFLVARLTRGNWLTALLVFVCASVVPAAIVLRLGLLR